MKLKFIITIFLAIILSEFSFATNYQKGDILYVVAFSGLSLRSEPNTTSSKNGKLSCKEEVIILNTFDFKENQDTIEGFTGNWVYVSGKDLKGYVFDAFISSLPFINDFEVLKGLGDNHEGIFEILPDLLEEYALKAIGKTGCEFKYPSLRESENAHGFVFNKLNNGHNLINHGYWEGFGTELEFYNLRKSEVYYFMMHLTHFIPKNIFEINEQLLKSQNTNYNHCLDKDYFGSDCSLRVFQKEGNIISVFFSFFT
jgi:hypothetical protein